MNTVVQPVSDWAGFRLRLQQIDARSLALEGGVLALCLVAARGVSRCFGRDQPADSIGPAARRARDSLGRRKLDSTRGCFIILAEKHGRAFLFDAFQTLFLAALPRCLEWNTFRRGAA